MTGAADETVLDASAVLAFLQEEPGSDIVAGLIAGAVISAVNLSEVVAKLTEKGLDATAVEAVLGSLGLDVVAFDTTLAVAAGLLRAETRAAGLSLGDRACLALARRRGATALTADRAWVRLAHGVRVRLVR